MGFKVRHTGPQTRHRHAPNIMQLKLRPLQSPLPSSMSASSSLTSMAAQNTNTRGRGTSSRSRGHGSRGSAPIPTSSRTSQPSKVQGPKIPTIQWEKWYSARTTRLIEWCKLNDDARIKLFSDLAKDAKEEG